LSRFTSGRQLLTVEIEVELASPQHQDQKENPMSGQIKLRADEAHEHAQDVRDTKAAAADLITDMRGRLTTLIDSFEGRTQEAFIAKLDEVKAGLDELLNGMDGLGTFLSSAATAIVDLDTSLAAQLAPA
jgi:WXG100 family type VII secretion target